MEKEELQQEGATTPRRGRALAAAPSVERKGSVAAKHRSSFKLLQPAEEGESSMEAQRLLESTLPRFLDRVDDYYKVPFNFKLGEGGPQSGKGAEDATMLVPLGSFNPVPKILRAIQSGEVEKERLALQADCDNMDQAMQIIVDAYYNGFNKSLASYGHILRYICSSKDSVALLKAQLAGVKTCLNIRDKELRKLWLRKTEYTETLRILDEIDQVKIGWERVEHHLDAKDWVEAARVLVQCMRIVDQDEIRQVGAIYDIRLYLADVHAKFHTRVIEELHQIIYLKQAAPVANLDTSGQTPQESAPSLLARSTADPQQITQPLESLVESLFIVKRVPEAVEALYSRVRTETRSVIDAGISSVVAQYQKSAKPLPSSLHPTRFHIPNPPLENLLRSLFESCVRILLLHKRVQACLRSFAESTHEFTSSLPKGKAPIYSVERVWEAIQEEMISLFRVHLATNTQNSENQFSAVDGDQPRKTQRKLFHFADSSAATYNLTGGKEGASALAALQLFKPSPFNIITVYPLLEQFNNDVVRSALVITETGEQSMMVEFVNEFVEKVYLPHLRQHYRGSLSHAVESPDAFKPWERQRAESGEDNKNWPRSVVYCVSELVNIVRDAAHAITVLPSYSFQIAQVVEDLCLSFSRRCRVAYENATENSLAARIVSNSLVCAQLELDSLWIKQMSDTKEEARSKTESRNPPRASGRSLSPRRSSPRKREGSIVEGFAGELAPSYLYEGEAKFSRENPIARADLLFDSSRLLYLGNLAESLEWLVQELGSVCIELDRRRNDKSLSSNNKESSNSTLNDTVGQFTFLAKRCLFTLKVEVRLHAFHFLDRLQKCSYVVEDETPEPDGCVVELTKDLGALEGILSRILSQHKIAYLFGGLEGLIASIVMCSLPKIKTINPNGVWKMCRNLFAIEQSLSQLGHAGSGVAFENARRFYRLLTLPPEELMVQLSSIASPTPQAQLWGVSSEEYKSLLAYLERSPASHYFDFASLRALHSPAPYSH